jgi:hypothetical protein
VSELERLLVVQDHDLSLDRLRHRRETLPARTDLAMAGAGIAALAPGLADARARRDAVARDASTTR